MNSAKNKAEHKADLQAVLVRVEAWQCCLNCLNWTTRREITRDADGNVQIVDSQLCGKFNAVPPPHIIVHGCRDHEADIPF
jgi:hypothetical protein